MDTLFDILKNTATELFEKSIDIDETSKCAKSGCEKCQGYMEKAKKDSKPFKGYNPEKHSRTGGLNAKERARINREEGSNLKAPVTEKNPSRKDAARRRSFCARMKGNPGPTSKDGKLTPKGAALKRWNCGSVKKSESESPYYVGLVVFNDTMKKVLLGRRKEDGIWTGPGGGADMGELPKEAALRELWEEARIKSKPELLFTLPTLDAKNGKKCYCFFLQVLGDQEAAVYLDPDEEVDAWGWYSINQPLPEPMNEGRKQNILNAITAINGIQKAMVINQEITNSTLDTTDYSINEMGADDHPMVARIDEMMKDMEYGSAPREMDVDDKYKLILVRSDDGIFSGHLKEVETGEMRMKIEKLNTPSIVQALKAKGYLKADEDENGSESDPNNIAEQVKEIVEEHEETWEDRDGTPEEQAADAAAFEEIEELVNPEIHEASDEGMDREELSEILDALQGRGIRDVHIHFHKAVDELFTKSLGEYFEKAGRLPIGTIKKYAGNDYQKIKDGKWVKVTDTEQLRKEEEEIQHQRQLELIQAKNNQKNDESVEKGRKPFPIGSKSPDGKRIKTADGWKPIEQPKQTKVEEKESKPSVEQQNLKQKGDASEEARQEAEKEMSEDEYVNARDSKFQNLGEDIKGSARHKRAEWKGLQAAEKDGSAEKMVKRDTLLKMSPPEFDMTEGSPSTILALNTALKSFPKEPDYGRGRRFDESKEKVRELYVEAYQKVKEYAEGLQNVDDPIDAIQQLRAKVKPMIVEEGSRNAKNNSQAQMLVNYFNNTLATGYRAGARSVIGKMAEFAKVAKDKSPEETVEAIRQMVYENKTVNAAFGNKKEGQRKLTAADMYVRDAEREGPEGLKSSEAQTKYLMEKAEMRGIQWGNSVTDEERKHHLEYVANSFKDLTDVLGLPEQMGSFNGRLGLAIGARGKGRAMAHYEPAKKVINLTRKNGVGSLAHEWGHFFDNILGEVSKTTSYGRGGPYISEEGSVIADYGKKTDGSNPTLEAVSELFKSNEYKQFRKQVVEYVRENRDTIGKGTEYWASTKEMWARSFEAYVTHKLSEAGRTNTYLSGQPNNPLWPSKEQSAKLAPYFDKIMETFKSSDLLKKAFDFIEETID